jgi:hypothetical protein
MQCGNFLSNCVSMQFGNCRYYAYLYLHAVVTAGIRLFLASCSVVTAGNKTFFLLPRQPCKRRLFKKYIYFRNTFYTLNPLFCGVVVSLIVVICLLIVLLYANSWAGFISAVCNRGISPKLTVAQFVAKLPSICVEFSSNTMFTGNSEGRVKPAS